MAKMGYLQWRAIYQGYDRSQVSGTVGQFLETSTIDKLKILVQTI